MQPPYLHSSGCPNHHSDDALSIEVSGRRPTGQASGLAARQGALRWAWASRKLRAEGYSLVVSDQSQTAILQASEIHPLRGAAASERQSLRPFPRHVAAEGQPACGPKAKV